MEAGSAGRDPEGCAGAARVSTECAGRACSAASVTGAPAAPTLPSAATQITTSAPPRMTASYLPSTAKPTLTPTPRTISIPSVGFSSDSAAENSRKKSLDCFVCSIGT